MDLKLSIIIFITFFLISLNVFPQHYLFESYSSDKGLSQTDVRGIEQDDYGFIWTATQDGLDRWDGYSFKVYRNDPDDQNTISSSLIGSLFKDKEGFLWVGTGDGLNKFDPATGKNIRYLSKIGDSTRLQGKLIFDIKEDVNNIWVGTYQGGLSALDKKTNKFRTYRYNSSNPNSLGSDNVLRILIDDGILWLTTFPNGLCRFDPEKNEFKTFTLNGTNIPDSYSSFTTYIGKIDKDYILVGTYKGLVIFNKNDFTYKRIEDIRDIKGNSYALKRINPFVGDKYGNFYIGTTDQGLIKYNMKNNSFVNIRNNEFDSRSLSDNFISSVYIDRDNNLWVGTMTGLNRLIKTKAFDYINQLTELKLSNYLVRAAYEDSKGRLWVGTEYGLNIINKEKTSIKYLTNDGKTNPVISGGRVLSICSGDNGTVWVGTNDGINQFDVNLNLVKKIKTNPADGIFVPLFNIQNMFRDSKNNLWLGTHGLGLIFYNPELNLFKLYVPDNKDPNSISDPAIYDVKEDTRGNIWVGSALGLNKFNRDNKNFTRFMHDSENKKSLPVNEVNAILPNEDGTLWLGMQGAGLILFDEKRGVIKSYTTAKGLANNIVDAIEKDDSGNLWIATNEGLSKIDLSSNKIYSFFDMDGLPDHGFYLGASYKSENGILYFGSSNGVVFFNPAEIKTEKKASSIIITNFKVFEKSVPGREIIKDKETIGLDYNNNFFSFEFAALDFSENFKYSYAYMLEGIDKDWVYSNSRRFASYTHIDPGNYVFNIKALNGSGEWIKGISIAVIITPPFWQTWWFRTILILIFISIGPVIYFRRVSSLKKDKSRQEEFTRKLITSQETERMRIASELHDSIGQNLIIIKNRAAFGVDFPAEGAQNQLKEIIDISTQTIREVKEISYNLRPYQLGKLGLTKAVEAVIKNASSVANMKFTVTIENIDGRLPEENEIHFYRIVQECLNNTIKHSQASQVNLNIAKNERQLLFSYADNGVGFNKSSLGSDKERTGMGLTTISERVNILHGNFNFESEPDKGVKINIQIPIERS